MIFFKFGCQFLDFTIIYHHVKNKKTNEEFSRKNLNLQIDRQIDRQTKVISYGLPFAKVQMLATIRHSTIKNQL